MTEHQDKHLDELLDSMLSTYSAAEPRPDLETMVLAKLRDAENREESRSWNSRWLWAGAAVMAAAVLLIFLSTARHSRMAVPENVAVQKQPPAQSQPQEQQALPAGAGNMVHHQRQKHAPVRVENAGLALSQRPSVFPTPTPLSDQERLLLSYYARTPREELIAQSHPDEPPVIGDDENNVVLPDLVSVPQKSSNTR